MFQICMPNKKNLATSTCDNYGPAKEKSDPCPQEREKSGTDDNDDGDGVSVVSAASTITLTPVPRHPTSTQHDFLGLSVHHFQTTLLKRSFAKGFNENSTIEDIMNDVILNTSSDTMCPITKKMGSSYVHSQQKHGANHVGTATFVIESLKDYSLHDINRELHKYCYQKKLDPKRTYVWLCCLCVNQHRMIEGKKRGKLPLWRCPPSCQLN